MKKLFCLLLFCGLFIYGQAQAYTINDAYWGGIPTHSFSPRDVIGDEWRFGISSMDVSSSGSTMTVVINTYYASAFLNNNTYGLGPGDLFISVNGWNPSGVGPNYTADTGSSGETWEFGVNGSGVYDLSKATIKFTNLDGLNPNSWVYRDGQEWTFASSASSLGGATQTIDGSQNTITYVFDTSQMGLTGAEVLGFHWTMQCGNDVIEGAAPVPEPATMLLLGSGLVGLAGFRKKFKR
jgi:hypothetical protein